MSVRSDITSESSRCLISAEAWDIGVNSDMTSTAYISPYLSRDIGNILHGVGLPGSYEQVIVLLIALVQLGRNAASMHILVIDCAVSSYATRERLYRSESKRRVDLSAL